MFGSDPGDHNAVDFVTAIVRRGDGDVDQANAHEAGSGDDHDVVDGRRAVVLYSPFDEQLPGQQDQKSKPGPSSFTSRSAWSQRCSRAGDRASG